MTDPLVDLGVRVGLIAAGGIAVVLGRRALGRWREDRRRRALRFGLASEVTEGQPTVLLFSGALCADCNRQKDILRALRDAAGDGWRLREVQAAREVDLARRFGVQSVPATVVLDQSGHAVAVNYGLVEAPTLSRQLGSLLGVVPAQR